MGLTMRERHAIVRELALRFQQATKKERGRMLDEFVQLTGYTVVTPPSCSGTVAGSSSGSWLEASA